MLKVRALEHDDVEVSVPSVHDSGGERPTRLFIVDDDSGIRTLLDVAASLDPRFEVVGMAATAAETMSFLEQPDAQVDVILLDVTLPDADGIEALVGIRTFARGARVALFTGWSDPETMARAQRAGADAIFPKDGDPQRLLDGIGALVAGPPTPSETTSTT